MLKNIILKLKQLFVSKKRLIIVLGAIFLITILLSIFSQSPPSLDQSSETLPQPQFSPYSKTFQPQKSTLKTTSSTPDKTVSVYKLPSFSNIDLQSRISPIANHLDLTNPPETRTYNSIPHLLWSTGSNYLNLNLNTGQFYLRYTPLVPPITPDLNESDTLQIAQQFLTQHNLINKDTPHKTKYLQTGNYEIDPAQNPDDADFYEFHFYPTLNTLPIYSTSINDSPVIITITKKGQIFELNYQIPVTFYSTYLTNPNSLTTSTHTIKTQQQINQAISQNLPTIVKSELEPDIPADPSINLKTITYNQITLGYQASPNQNLLIPVFQLQGTAELEDNNIVQITAYLSATP